MRTVAPPTSSSQPQWADLPDSLRARLADYAIHSGADWLKLSVKQRAQLFGVTRAMQRAATAAARGAR